MGGMYFFSWCLSLRTMAAVAGGRRYLFCAVVKES